VSLQASPANNGGMVIAVEDDGPGLPAPIRSQMFAPFVTTKASGTGLGLSISKKVVESLGGELQFLPRTPQGTRAEMVFHGTNTRN
jgi:two-component system sensor kinase FixL